MLKRVQHDKKGVIPNQVLNMFQDLSISESQRYELSYLVDRNKYVHKSPMRKSQLENHHRMRLLPQVSPPPNPLRMIRSPF
jgi:hypothetical protein